MTLLAYADVDSPLQRLHPLVKALWLIVVVVLASVTLVPITQASLLVYAVGVAVIAARLAPHAVWRAMLPFIPVALGYTLFNFLLLPGDTTLARLGPFAPSLEGLQFGLAITLRILVILATAVIFSTTTDPKTLTLSLIQNLHVPYRWGFALFVGLRFVPIATEEFQILRAAHLIRGVGHNPGIRGRMREYIRYAVPLLATVIRKAVRTGIAMDSKGFGAYPERTYVDRVVVRRQDVVLGVALAATAVAAWLIGTQLSAIAQAFVGAAG